MKTERRLKKWVKILLSIIILAFSTFVYIEVIKLGQKAPISLGYEILCAGGWVWLFFGQTFIYFLIWED